MDISSALAIVLAITMSAFTWCQALKANKAGYTKVMALFAVMSFTSMAGAIAMLWAW